MLVLYILFLFTYTQRAFAPNSRNAGQGSQHGPYLPEDLERIYRELPDMPDSSAHMFRRGISDYIFFEKRLQRFKESHLDPELGDSPRLKAVGYGNSDKMVDSSHEDADNWVAFPLRTIPNEARSIMIPLHGAFNRHQPFPPLSQTKKVYIHHESANVQPYNFYHNPAYDIFINCEWRFLTLHILPHLKSPPLDQMRKSDTDYSNNASFEVIAKTWKETCRESADSLEYIIIPKIEIEETAGKNADSWDFIDGLIARQQPRGIIEPFTWQRPTLQNKNKNSAQFIGVLGTPLVRAASNVAEQLLGTLGGKVPQNVTWVKIDGETYMWMTLAYV